MADETSDCAACAQSSTGEPASASGAAEAIASEARSADSTSPDPGVSQTVATDPHAATLAELLEGQRAMSERLNTMDAALASLDKRVSLIPPQVLALRGKVEGLGGALAEPRYRALLLNVIDLYDLVDQMLRNAPEGAERSQYDVLRTQIRQLLQTNGLTEVVCAGAFDPTQHRAMRRVPCDSPEGAGQIHEVLRPGFRTEQGVLRYADVVVTRQE